MCDSFPDAKPTADVAATGTKACRISDRTVEDFTDVALSSDADNRGLLPAASSNSAVVYAAALTGSVGRTTRYDQIASCCDGRCRYEYVQFPYVGRATDGYIDNGHSADGYVDATYSRLPRAQRRWSRGLRAQMGIIDACISTLTVAAGRESAVLDSSPQDTR